MGGAVSHQFPNPFAIYLAHSSSIYVAQFETCQTEMFQVAVTTFKNRLGNQGFRQDSMNTGARREAHKCVLACSDVKLFQMGA